MPKILYEMGMYKHPNILLLYPQVLEHESHPQQCAPLLRRIHIAPFCEAPLFLRIVCFTLPSCEL